MKAQGAQLSLCRETSAELVVLVAPVTGLPGKLDPPPKKPRSFSHKLGAKPLDGIKATACVDGLGLVILQQPG